MIVMQEAKTNKVDVKAALAEISAKIIKRDDG